MRRGRRALDGLIVGDTLDWWRVEAFEPDRRLRLAAEMKVPGRAWLEFEVDGEATGSTIRQTAMFDPVGLLGLLYWYAMYPLHSVVFAGMLRGIVQAVEGQHCTPARGTERRRTGSRVSSMRRGPVPCSSSLGVTPYEQ
jgi:Protein of unknown function (DUF2867)